MLEMTVNSTLVVCNFIYFITSINIYKFYADSWAIGGSMLNLLSMRQKGRDEG